MADKKETSPPTSPAEATPPQTPDTTRVLRVPTQLPRATATFEGPTGTGRGQRTSAPESQQKKVGVTSHVVTVSVDEFEALKFELEKAQRNISPKQNKLAHEKQRAIQHQQQLHDQLTTAVEREEHAVQRQRDIQNSLDQAEVDLHTLQNEKVQLELQKQNKIDLIKDAAELVRIQSQRQQQQQIEKI